MATISITQVLIAILVLLLLCTFCLSKEERVELKDFEKWMNAEECFSMAVEGVQMRCKDMHEEERFFLQLDFTNCYLSMMNLEQVSCSPRTRRECSRILNDPRNKIQDSVFQKFYMDLPNLCYHAANHLWQKSLSSRTANLKNFSEQTMRGVEKSVRNSKKLEHTQQNSLANQENILSQSEKVKASVEDQYREMKENFEDLTSNVTQQSSMLKSFGSQLQISLKWVSESVFYIFGEALELELLLLFLFVFIFITYLSSVHQARGTIKMSTLVVFITVTMEFFTFFCVQGGIISQETTVYCRFLLRRGAICLVFVMYVVIVGRRLIWPPRPVTGDGSHLEDYDTHLLVQHLVGEIGSMEAHFVSSGLLPPENVPPMQSSSPQIVQADSRQHTQSSAPQSVHGSSPFAAHSDSPHAGQTKSGQVRNERLEQENRQRFGGGRQDGGVGLNIIPESTGKRPFANFTAGIISSQQPDNRDIQPSYSALDSDTEADETVDSSFVVETSFVNTSFVSEESHKDNVHGVFETEGGPDNKEVESSAGTEKLNEDGFASEGRIKKSSKTPKRNKRKERTSGSKAELNDSYSRRYNLRPRSSLHRPSTPSVSSYLQDNDDSLSEASTSSSYSHHSKRRSRK